MSIELLKYFLIAGLFTFGIGCTDKPVPATASKAAEKVDPSLPINLLAGDWELSAAERNGKNTEALEGIYFNFTEDQTLISNFNLDTEEHLVHYKVEGKSLVTDGNPSQRFLIESLDSNEVVLLTKMANFNFRLLLIPFVEDTKMEEPI